MDDLSAILPDIKAKIEDCEDERKNMDQLKNLAKDALVGNIVHSLYNAMFWVHGNGSCYEGTLIQRNYRQMTILWSFSFNPFVKF